MSKRKSAKQVYLFATIVCVTCSIILAGASTLLMPYQKANVKLDVVRNILTVVGHDPDTLASSSAQACFDLYAKEFEGLLVNKDNQKADLDFMRQELGKLGYQAESLAEMDATDLLDLFNARVNLLARRSGQPVEAYNPHYKLIHIWKPEGPVKAYVIPIQGKGLWDVIKGYLALEPDLNTVMGITFYEHKETPGLGSRITEDWFKNQFIGKKILDQKGNLVSVTVSRGKYLGNDTEHFIDGISGATLTGDGVTRFLHQTLADYESFFKTLRQQDQPGRG